VFKWLLILPVVAFIDPFLFYWMMWPHMNTWSLWGFLLGYPLLATLYSRSRPAPEGDVLLRFLRWLRHVATWYVGPIFKLASFLLLIPPIETAVSRFATRRLQSQILRGMGGMSARGMGNIARPNEAPGNLKETKGRMVE
jgi:hypothetical protein